MTLHHSSISYTNCLMPEKLQWQKYSETKFQSLQINSLKYIMIKGKDKAVTVTDCEGPLGCERSRLPHLLDNRLRDGGKAPSLTPWQPFTPRRFLVLISVSSWVDPSAIVRLEGLGHLKNPITSLGFNPTISSLQHSASTNYATEFPKI
jgi:hypothetical protein